MRKILLGYLTIWTLFIFYQGTHSSSVWIQSNHKVIHQVVNFFEKVSPKSETDL